MVETAVPAKVSVKIGDIEIDAARHQAQGAGEKFVAGGGVHGLAVSWVFGSKARR